MRLEITIEGDKQAIQNIENLSKFLSNPLEPLEQTRKYYLSEVLKNYTSEGAYFGVKWKPLSQRRIREKKELGYPMDILVATGLMKGNFRGDINSGKNAKSISGENLTGILTIHNPIHYFKEHQIGIGNIPQRIMLRLDMVRRKRIFKIFQDWTAKIITSIYKNV